MAPSKESDTKPQEKATPSTSGGAKDDGTGLTTPIMKGSSESQDEKKGTKGNVQIHEPPVTETRGYTIVKVEEKHGPLYQAIPVMPLPLAVLFCVFNIVLPGVGTLFAAFTVFCCGPSRISRPCKAFGLNLASAFLQMLTFLLIVGWVWSVRWGITFVELSLSRRGTYKNIDVNPYYVRRQSSVDYEKQTSHHSPA